MSKKDYQAIAAVLYSARLDAANSTASPVQSVDYCAARLAVMLRADNPAFNRALFLEACETGACKGMKRREVA